MDSDESTTIADAEDAAWVAQQRDTVIEYLARQQCEHNGVSREPRWFLSPYVAIWAVRSRLDTDRIGWWAISGDLPTDYISAGTQRTSGDVLIAFADQWDRAVSNMAMGGHVEGYIVGDPAQAKELSSLLRRRAELIREFGVDLNTGSSAGEG